jgi:hypothetical protein
VATTLARGRFMTLSSTRCLLPDVAPASGTRPVASATRIDKLHRPLPNGAVDVVFVVRRESAAPRSAWITGEEFPRRPDESVEALVDRALRDYRLTHPPRAPASALIVDCSR